MHIARTKKVNGLHLMVLTEVVLPTVNVDGYVFHDRYGSDGQTDIAKSVAYNTKLTVASDKDLNIITGGIYMTDGTPKQDGSGELEPASYTPQTSEIASVDVNDYASGWSGQVTDPVNAFDGNLTTTYTNPSTYNASYAWNGSIPFTTLKITYYTIDAQAGSAGVGTLTVNGSVVRTGDSPGSTYGNRNPYTEDFSSLITSPLTSIAITTQTNGSSAGVYGIEVDGKVLKDGTVLTFNSPNPDLQYFEVGDVVQKGSGLVELDTSNTNKFTNPENAFDDNEDTYAEVIADDTNSFLHFTIAPGITSITCVIENTNMTESNAFYIQSGNGGHANSGTWTVTNGYTVSGNQITVPANSGKVRLTFELPADANVGRYYPHRGRAGFRIYNTPDASIPPASITAIDTAANTMTVDGGDWAGTDGSGGDGRYLPSQQWSANPTNVLSTNVLYGFDDTLAYTSTDGAVTEAYYTFDPPIDNVDNISCYAGNATWNSAYSFFVEETDGTRSSDTLSGSGSGVNLGGNASVVKIGVLSNGAAAVMNMWSIVKVDGLTLIDSSIPGGGETNVTGSTETAEGTILQSDGTEVDLSASSGRWIADNKAGIPFSFVPSTPIVDTQNEAYGKLQIINDKAQVTGIQASDPGFLNVTAKNYSIKFPSVFATGNAPDVDLPAGCAISAIVKAENSAGASVKESNVLLPQTPNPEGSAGPITDVEGGGTNVYTTDTIASVDVPPVTLWSANANWLVVPTAPTSCFDGGAGVSNILTATSPLKWISPRPIYASKVWLDVNDATSGAQTITLVTDKNTYVTTDLVQRDMSAYPGATGYVAEFVLSGREQIISIEASNSGYEFYYMRSIILDGFMLTDNVPYPLNERVLTFPTSNNLDKFEVGEVVQSAPGTNQSQEWSDFGSGDYPSPSSWKDTFDNDSSTRGAVALENESLVLDLSALTGGGISYTTSVVITYNRNTAAPDLTVNGSAVGATADGTDRTYTINGTGLLFRVGSTVRTSGSQGDFAIKQIEVDDKILVDSSIPGGVSITAIDDTVPSITVDGGEWLGSDNSGDPAGDTDITKTVTYGSKLTVGTDANLDTFIAADALVMVDDTGAVASYTPQTSEIASVVSENYSSGL